MVYKNLCILVHWTKVASALEGSQDNGVAMQKEFLTPSYFLICLEKNDRDLKTGKDRSFPSHIVETSNLN